MKTEVLPYSLTPETPKPVRKRRQSNWPTVVLIALAGVLLFWFAQ